MITHTTTPQQSVRAALYLREHYAAMDPSDIREDILSTTHTVLTYIAATYFATPGQLAASQDR